MEPSLMRRMLLIALMLMTGTVWAETPQNAIVVLSDGGQFARNTFPRKASWLGLFCDGMNCHLDEAFVALGDGIAEHLGEDEPTDVIHALYGHPIALFSGIALPEGQVQTWFRHKDYHDDAPVKNLKKLGAWKMPWGNRPLTLSWVRLPEGTFRYHISDGQKKQFLFALSPESHHGSDTSTPGIYWVGDLDQDGAIDFLLNVPYGDCEFDMRLYLSSTAEPGELVHKSAQLSGGEPACGC